jgi:uncharacterized protein (TIGR00369 family)
MTSELHDLLEACIQNASVDDTKVLKELLQGVHFKQLHGVGFVSGLLQMERKMDEQSCEITMPITPVTMNPLGIVHGGITATLIDSAMGSLSNHLVPEGEVVVTTQLNINYLAPGSGDYLKCITQVDHKGSKTMVLSATVYRNDGKKVAQGTGSFFIIKSNSI